MNQKMMVLLFLLFQIVLYTFPVSAEDQSNGFLLKGGKLFKVNNTSEEIFIEGNVLSIYRTNEVIWYIKEVKGTWYSGDFNVHTGHTNEYILGNNFVKLYKLMAQGNVYFFLADIEKQVSDKVSQIEKILTRFDPESSEQKVLSGVDDFTLVGNNPVILNSSGINCNGVIIPVLIKGKTHIDKIIDSRFLFVTNGADFEVFDLLSKRNIYQYREGMSFPYNADYNIIIEFCDVAANNRNMNNEDNTLYYQLTLNGFDVGRTEASPAEITKSSMLKAETDRYSIIKAERWELDKDKGRYIRVNNVNQPDEMKIFIPDNRIIKIKVEFNGTEYTITQSVYEQ